MTVITKQDFIDSVADSLQYISFYHPVDFIRAMGEAYEREASPAAKDAMAQILTNSRRRLYSSRPMTPITSPGRN